VDVGLLTQPAHLNALGDRQRLLQLLFTHGFVLLLLLLLLPPLLLQVWQWPHELP
jgi:hypothetical protein